MAAVLSFLEQQGVAATLNESWATGVLCFIRDNESDLQSTSQVVDRILKTVRRMNGQLKFAVADIASRHSVHLLYKYKSTNTDAEDAPRAVLAGRRARS